MKRVMQGFKQKFFLISFLPAMAYWYMEENYPVRIAITAGIILAILEIVFEKIFCQKVHTLSKFNFFLIIIMGGLSLMGEDGMWFKLTPFLTGIFISGFLFWQIFKNKKSLFYETLKEMKDDKDFPLPDFVIKQILFSTETHFAFFILLYANWMGAVAVWGTSNQWIFFKTLGQYLVFFIFAFFEFIIMRVKIKKILKAEQKARLLKQF